MSDKTKCPSCRSAKIEFFHYARRHTDQLLISVFVCHKCGKKFLDSGVILNA